LSAARTEKAPQCVLCGVAVRRVGNGVSMAGV
jgi:hypothetical protein